MKKGSSIQSGVRVRESLGSRIFTIINGLFLVLLALMCVLPLVNILAVSLSSNAAATAGLVKLWPVEFTLKSYEYVAKRAAFWRSLGVTLLRCLLGVSLNVLMCILTAYPLSKDNQKLRARTVYTWFFFITMLISGGMIPNFVLIGQLGLRDNILALILPGALPVFNLVLMINFFRQVPIEMEEAAMIDGASHVKILAEIYVPLSKAAMATISLFCMVNHWNAWFDGMIYMKSPEKLPLQTYLRNIIIKMDMSQMTGDDYGLLQMLSNDSIKCTQIVVAVIPILCVYPFLQKYFVKGIVLGGVKG